MLNQRDTAMQLYEQLLSKEWQPTVCLLRQASARGLHGTAPHGTHAARVR